MSAAQQTRCRFDMQLPVWEGLAGFVDAALEHCSFWLVTALAMTGETKRAHALCQKLLSFAGPLLLYAEEIDATTGQHLGNFPQAFTHLALIDAVSKLIEMEETESKQGSASVTA